MLNKKCFKNFLQERYGSENPFYDIFNAYIGKYLYKNFDVHESGYAQMHFLKRYSLLNIPITNFNLPVETILTEEVCDLRNFDYVIKLGIYLRFHPLKETEIYKLIDFIERQEGQDKSILLEDLSRNQTVFLKSLSPEKFNFFKHPFIISGNIDNAFFYLEKGLTFLNPFLASVNTSLSLHPSITENIISSHLNEKWDWEMLLSNPNISLKFIKKHKKILDWRVASRYINIKNLLQCLDKPLKWEFVSKNPYIKMSDIENNPALPWKWRCVSKNPNLYMGFIEKFKDKDWDWNVISTRLDINIDFVAKNKDKKWSIEMLSQNASIEVSDIEKYRDLGWRDLSRNPNITPEFIIENRDLKWDFQKIARYNRFILRMLKKFKTVDWDFEQISQNNYLDLQTVEWLCKSITWRDFFVDFWGGKVWKWQHVIRQKYRFHIDQKVTPFLFQKKINERRQKIRLHLSLNSDIKNIIIPYISYK